MSFGQISRLWKVVTTEWAARRADAAMSDPVQRRLQELPQLRYAYDEWLEVHSGEVGDDAGVEVIPRREVKRIVRERNYPELSPKHVWVDSLDSGARFRRAAGDAARDMIEV